jgi:hypothetical protein
MEMALQTAIGEYRQRRARDSGRMRAIQAWVCSELAARGIEGARAEVRCTGAYRDKNWDVALTRGDQVLLAVSTKTLVSNHGGSVPNRIDDMVGEAANLHRMHPGAVLGYLAFMHFADEGQRVRQGADPVRARLWYDRWAAAVERAGQRVRVDDPAETWEAASVNFVDLDAPTSCIASVPLDPHGMLDQLARLFYERHG